MAMKILGWGRTTTTTISTWIDHVEAATGVASVCDIKRGNFGFFLLEKRQERSLRRNIVTRLLVVLFAILPCSKLVASFFWEVCCEFFGFFAMSRCYPFPPPGYEKKTRTEDIDLLKKEKNREKKHKKEKRDKEKKDGKEKRERDRSDEKQKEKKEKKEKHRDKRKDKEKVRDKDKNNHVISEEKKFPGHAEAEKVEQNYEKSKEREKEKSTVLGEKVLGISAVCNGVVLGKNNHLASERKNYRQLHELGSKNGTEEGRVIGMTRNRVEGMARQVEKNVVWRMEVKEKIKGIEGDGKKGEKRKYVDREKSVEKYKEKVKKIKLERPKYIGGEMLVEQSRIKDSNKVHADLLRVKDVNKKDSVVAQSARPTKPVKEDIKAAASATPEVLRKRKDFSPNGFLHVGDAGPNKVPRITSSSIPVTENGRRPFQNSTTFFAPVKQQALSNTKQDEADLGPNKMARITSSSLLVTENGRSLQPSQESTILTPLKQEALSNTPVKLHALSNTPVKQHALSNTNLKQQAPSNTPVKQQALSNTPVKQQAQSKVKQNSKDHRINSTSNSPQSSSRASQSTAPADRNSRAVKKLLPHPDTKYLTRVLSVPQMEEWSGFDEQEWLFRSSHSQLNKPKEEIARVDGTIQQVWAEAVRIESADVYALPYVIPR
ncbi:hypothetical protein V2J09_017748 [Rumex salicifolius]